MRYFYCLIPLLFCINIHAKTQRVISYEVQQGDWVYKVLRQRNLLQANESRIIKQIKKLNPEIKNLNKIEPRQMLKIPYFVYKTYVLSDKKISARLPSSILFDAFPVVKNIDEQKPKIHTPYKKLGITINSITSFSKLNILELADQSKANIYSERNSGFSAIFEKNDYEFIFNWLQYDYSGKASSIANSRIHKADMMLLAKDKSGFIHYKYGFKYAQKNYLTSINSSILRFMTANHPGVMLSIDVPFIQNDSNQLELNLLASYNFSSSVETLTINDNLEYGATVTWKHKICSGFSTYAQLFWNKEDIKTSVSQQQKNELGFMLGIGF